MEWPYKPALSVFIHFQFESRKLRAIESRILSEEQRAVHAREGCGGCCSQHLQVLLRAHSHSKRLRGALRTSSQCRAHELSVHTAFHTYKYLALDVSHRNKVTWVNDDKLFFYIVMKDKLKDLEPASWGGGWGAGGDYAPWFNLISEGRAERG